jgi:GTP-binding protein Era
MSSYWQFFSLLHIPKELNMTLPENFKAGFVSIVGKANVGKSTLMNRILGEKLSIVTPKPQTTRVSIKGIYNSDDMQIIFLDTPGFVEPRYELHNRMINYIKESLKDSDLIIFITDINDFPTEYDQKVIELIKEVKKPSIALLNKIDLCTESMIRDKTEKINQSFDKVYPISALYVKEIDSLLKEICTFLPYNPPLYSQEDMSDLPMRFFAQEIIRERIFMNLDQEIPYSSAVVVDAYEEHERHDFIRATIYLERETQKPILLGKNGAKIGKIRREAELGIQQLSGKPTKLNLWIKVKPDWRKKSGLLSIFGYK